MWLPLVPLLSCPGCRLQGLPGTEIVEKIAKGLVAGMMANVISFEKAQAAAAAVANILRFLLLQFPKRV